MTWDEQGFAQIPRWLLHDGEISSHAKLVYAGLSSYVNRRGVAVVKHSTLASTCSLSPATVRRALNELEGLGVLLRSVRFVRGEQRANVYELRTAPVDESVDGDGDEH